MLKNKGSNISRPTIDRLPIYFRTLRLIQAEGSGIVSSEELGLRIGVTPEQIRKDLASFGAFGRKGVGYHVDELLQNIVSILGLDRHWSIAIVGVGHLGWALANYRSFSSLGFEVKALFDQNPAVIGQVINGIEVLPISRMVEIFSQYSIQIGVITVPAPEAQKVADMLVEAGARGIWNFAPVNIKVPQKVKVESVDLSVGLSVLSFQLCRTSASESAKDF